MCRNLLYVDNDEKKELVKRYFNQYFLADQSAACPEVFQF
jgi:hypothetical protein